MASEYILYKDYVVVDGLIRIRLMLIFLNVLLKTFFFKNIKLFDLFATKSNKNIQSSMSSSSSPSSWKTVWCGPHAAQALIEAVTSLRKSIRSLSGELLVRYGDPSIILPQVAADINANEIHYHEEPGTYESDVVQKLKMHYFDGKQGVKLVSKSGYTLYHPDDLPKDPNDWNIMAHPKQKNKKRRNKKKVAKNVGDGNIHKSSQYNNDMAYCPSYYSNFDLVDVSSDRFKGICRVMGDFRKAARNAAEVRKTQDAPEHLMKPPDFEVSKLRGGEGYIPTLEELMLPMLNLYKKKVGEENVNILGLSVETIEFVYQSAIKRRNEKKMNKGGDMLGELSALNRLEYFIEEGHADIADRSKADVSDNDSSRLSIHLALGTISPRTIFWRAHSAGSGCEWLMSHLEMRDFFLYTTYSCGNRLFRQEGIPVNKKEQGKIWKNPSKTSNESEKSTWTRWASGKTQLPLVDAAMLELMSTGYCSNRVRQNVASVLVKDLDIDWRAGAEWFQFLLEDHCVGANFGNWLYFSGVGPDPKQRHFRTVSQLKRYDSKGEYVKKWLPVLNDLSYAKGESNIEALFRPWDFKIDGFDSPIVDPDTQYTFKDLEQLKKTGNLLDFKHDHR